MYQGVVWMIALLVLAGLPACSCQVMEPAPGSVRTVGTITQVPPLLDTYDFLIEESPDQQLWHAASPLVEGDKFYVGVTEKTEIQRRTSTVKVQRMSLQEIARGMRAEVWFVGPVLESYPAQATAGRILILDPAP